MFLSITIYKLKTFNDQNDKVWLTFFVKTLLSLYFFLKLFSMIYKLDFK